ncbi:MAG: DUF6384 family protein [Pseudomonadota bacterium]
MAETDTVPVIDETTGEARPLDDVLLAMDVVDTLRHRENMVARELDAEGREAQLIERLREIYAAQGIEVPDRILKDGVKALEEKRFVYTPPEPSFSVWLAKLYVSRDRWLKPLIGAVGALVVGLGAYQFGVAGPANAKAEAQRVELQETIPADLARLRNEAQAAALSDDVDAIAEGFYQNGIAAVAEGDRDDARTAVTALETLKADLAAVYTVRVVSRPGELSGVFRIPDDLPSARNYYLIVEAIGPSGAPVTVPLASEEDQSVRRVSKWGQRVPQAVFDEVAADKRDDQIIQNAVIGRKSAGMMEPDYSVEIAGGAIFEW